MICILNMTCSLKKKDEINNFKLLTGESSRPKLLILIVLMLNFKVKSLSFSNFRLYIGQTNIRAPLIV